MESFIIGIAGGTGSGKTTLTKRLKERFGDDVSVISHDNYYKRHDELPYEERCRLNYDHPDAFDTDLMVEQVQALRRGETIACPVYDFTVHNRSEDTLLIAPTSVIILEGILIFADSKLRDLMDVKIFVDTDADVRILRRVVRDVKKRGRTLERGAAISYDRQAYARAVCGAEQALCGHHRARGRQKSGCTGYDHPAGGTPYPRPAGALNGTGRDGFFPPRQNFCLTLTVRHSVL